MKPVHQKKIMDDDMLILWEKAKPLPSEIRLYGGTALALYLGHRRSADFDFVHVNRGITKEWIRKYMAPFHQGTMTGGPGMVDILWDGPNRKVKINYAECGGSFIPYPVHPPVIARNGVPVGHIKDVVAAKLRALQNRDAARDYQDVAACIEEIPEAVREAASILEEQNDNIYRLAKAMSAPGSDAQSHCAERTLNTVADFAAELVVGARRTEPGANS